MAMSLEDLLVEEGFNKGKFRISSRRSLGPESKNMQIVSNHGPRRPGSAGSSSGNRRTSRTRSDVSRHRSRADNVMLERVKGRMSKDNSFSQEIEPKIVRRQSHERRSSRDSVKATKYNAGPVEESPRYEVNETADTDEITEVAVHENGRYNEIYSNDVNNIEGESEAQDDMRIQENGSCTPPEEKEILLDKRYSHNSNENLSFNTSLDDYPKKSMNKTGTSNRNSENSKATEKKKVGRNADIEQDLDIPALDEAAILALISILTSYPKRFLKDEEFRASLRHSSFASLNFMAHEDNAVDMESKVIRNLEDAIETVEMAAEDGLGTKEVKKASLQLSVITGLNINDLKDGHTSGIANFKLSACAHLYLSVIYVLQKKDRIAAKHLLQVLCDSPFQARTALLTDLWDQIFTPHLSELKDWYNKEAASLVHSPSNARKLTLLEKVFNEILDSGTYQLAAYYKDWLTEGVEAPPLPSIQIPSIPFELTQEEDQDNDSFEAGSPADSLPSQATVSKKLYNAVFQQTTKTGSEEVDCEEESFEISSHYAAHEGNSSSETVKQTVLNVKYGVASHLEVEEAERSVLASTSEKIRSSALLRSWSKRQVTSGNLPSFDALAPAEISEMILKKLAKVIFEQQLLDNSIDSACGEVLLLPDSMPAKLGSPGEEIGSFGGFEGDTFFNGVPQDFVCPLTEVLFEDPVTLETGHTYERLAITNWFDRGNIACPMTGKQLECQSVPQTNLILKRIIDSWRSEHYRRLIELASNLGDGEESKDEIAVFILEQLLMASSEEERIRNVRQIVTGGGLQFLLCRFHVGNMAEKTRISTILLICILTITECRNYICLKIDRLSLLDLLHCENLKTRTTAVSLLTEIVCLNRRKDAMYFLDGLQREETLSALHVLLMLLQSCEADQRPQVAVLLLHFDLLVEPQKYSVYRGEAVDAITLALESSLLDEGIRENCCRALLVLGGHFSSAGKIMTEDWILKQAGFLDCPAYDSPDHEETNDLMGRAVSMIEDVDEESARERWLVNLSASLLGDGSMSFLEAISTCLMSEFSDLVRVCLTTVAWLSSSLASLSDAEFQLSAFSALISGLKICLEHGELVEHRVLASMSLLNFSKFPECRLLLMTMAEDIALALESLSEVTWTAKELYDTICS